MAYIPDRGDFVWLSFNPQAGHEQAGRRPALTLSPLRYNQVAGLALFCPITSQIKGYPFEVAIPTGLPISGVILADQLRSLDWNARQLAFIAQSPPSVISEVLGKIDALLKGQ
ncbi:MAG: endoribonuclease MazF [Anaerolineae bacterium]|nr:endoribonuclease MazF [Anaerolineae bacterium]